MIWSELVSEMLKAPNHGLPQNIMLQICIDVIVQRLGDAAAAAIYKLLFSIFNGRIATVSLYALPVCFQKFPSASPVFIHLIYLIRMSVCNKADGGFLLPFFSGLFTLACHSILFRTTSNTISKARSWIFLKIFWKMIMFTFFWESKNEQVRILHIY